MRHFSEFVRGVSLVVFKNIIVMHISNTCNKLLILILLFVVQIINKFLNNHFMINTGWLSIIPLYCYTNARINIIRVFNAPYYSTFIFSNCIFSRPEESSPWKVEGLNHKNNTLQLLFSIIFQQFAPFRGYSVIHRRNLLRILLTIIITFLLPNFLHLTICLFPQ